MLANTLKPVASKCSQWQRHTNVTAIRKAIKMPRLTRQSNIDHGEDHHWLCLVQHGRQPSTTHQPSTTTRTRWPVQWGFAAGDLVCGLCCPLPVKLQTPHCAQMPPLHLSLRVLLPQQLLVPFWLENCRCRRLLALASTVSAALVNRWLALP